MKAREKRYLLLKVKRYLLLLGPFCFAASQQWEVGTSREMQVAPCARVKSVDSLQSDEQEADPTICTTCEAL